MMQYIVFFILKAVNIKSLTIYSIFTNINKI